jgi:hypothetical protein
MVAVLWSASSHALHAATLPLYPVVNSAAECKKACQYSLVRSSPSVHSVQCDRVHGELTGPAHPLPLMQPNATEFMVS